MKIGISWIVYPIFCKQERKGFQISRSICSLAAGHCLLGQHKPALVSSSQICPKVSPGHPAAPRPSSGCRKAFCWGWWSWDLARPHSLLGQSLPQPLGDVLRQTGAHRLPWAASNSPNRARHGEYLCHTSLSNLPKLMSPGLERSQGLPW